MERFPSIKDDVEFVKNLISEQSVFPLPGQAFGLRVSYVQDFVYV